MIIKSADIHTTMAEIELGNKSSYSSVIKEDRPPQDIEWEDVSFKVGNNVILNKVWGKVNAGNLMCIMGPSGSGKSSLLNVLAGRSASTTGITIEGTVKVAGQEINPVSFRKNIAYVMQDDALMATAHPREALEFSASLRLPSTTTKEEIHEIVEKTLTELGIQDCADVLIGGELIKGISGGQRKRTSVGVEIVTKPSLLFLDEPTSGLDSYSAFNCVKLLKSLAKNDNAAVLCTIHQPSSEIFYLFDTCIFMREGKIFYQGAVSDITNYFNKFDYTCPNNYNPSDYVMFLIQTESSELLEKKGVGMTLSNNNLSERKRTSSVIAFDQSKIEIIPVSSASFWVQLKWLTWREMLNTKRDVASLIGRFGVTIFLAILYGIIFLNAGNQDDSNPSNFQSHFGAITMTVISSMFGSAQPIMLMFPFERPLFMREYSTGTYGPISYFVSKIVMELPLTFLQQVVQYCIIYFMVDMKGSWIYLVLASWGLGLASSSVAMALGAAVPNVKDVTELAPLLFVPQLLFAGFFIRTSQIPGIINIIIILFLFLLLLIVIFIKLVWMRWAQYLCAIKYSMNLVLMTEFDTSLDSCQGGAKANCEAVITSNDIDKDRFWVYIILLVVLFLGFRILASIILVHKAKRFY